jgi:hypothetical protein
MTIEGELNNEDLNETGNTINSYNKRLIFFNK